MKDAAPLSVKSARDSAPGVFLVYKKGTTFTFREKQKLGMAGLNFAVGEVESMGEKKKSEIHLFEVEFKNRIVKKLGNKPIRGQQGRWHPEKCLVMSKNETAIKEMISEKLASRRMYGIRRERESQLKREIKIWKIRRIGDGITFTHRYGTLLWPVLQLPAPLSFV